MIPVRLLHLSFRDFLVDPIKFGDRERYPFSINQRDTHGHLAKKYLELLCTGDNLRRDMCNLQYPGAKRCIDQRTIDSDLSPEIRYACRYWVHHLKESGQTIEDDDAVHQL